MGNRHGEEAFIEGLDIIWKSAEYPLMMAVREKVLQAWYL
jgi:hypothetical protein